MTVGDKLDPVALGHTAIDTKGLLLEHGYVMPQGSIAKLPQLPGEVQAAITAIEVLREQYETLDESKAFDCPFHKTSYVDKDGDTIAVEMPVRNYGMWRKEVSSGIEFLVCGECHRVVEVR
jgi:hypothetical protein